MRVVSVSSGKAIWLFETMELNPRGLDLDPISAAIRSRYAFAGHKNREEIEGARDGIKFERGSFKPDGSDSISVGFSIFNDGLVAETSAGTAYSEAFLEDLLAFVQKQHGLYFEPAMVRKRRYLSALLVESKQGLSKISEALASISAELTADTGRKYEAVSVSVGYDTKEPAEGLGPFLIERRSNVPFSANRFYSTAPLTTESHIKLLNQFESLMS